MRWQQLFADLQAQFEAEESAAEQAESALAGARRSRRACRSSTGCGGVARFPLVRRAAGARARWPACSWRSARTGCSLEDERRTADLVALAAVRSVAGLGRRTAVAEPAGPVRGRLDLRRALRGLARDRSAVQVVLDDGGVLSGTLDRVGADYVELAEHPADLPRRAEAVQGVRAVVIDAVAVVRTVAPGLG